MTTPNIRALIKEAHELTEQWGNADAADKFRHYKLLTLVDALEKTLGCLEWYSTAANYEPVSLVNKMGHEFVLPSEVQSDEGDKARTILKELEGE